MSTALRHEAPHHMTTDEFLDWASGAPVKMQLVDGEPRAMAPASAVHGAVQMNLGYSITQHLRANRSPCIAVTEPAIAPRVRARNNLRVSDLAVTCARLESGQVAVPEPIFVAEILSPSNEADTWDNVWAYASIPSVREILILRSTRIGAELLRRRPDGTWPDEPTSYGPDEQIIFESIGLTVPLAELYFGTYLARG